MPKTGMRKCPYCANVTSGKGGKCGWCGHKLPKGRK